MKKARSTNDTKAKHNYLTPNVNFEVKKNKTLDLMTPEEWREFCQKRRNKN